MTADPKHRHTAVPARDSDGQHEANPAPKVFPAVQMNSAAVPKSSALAAKTPAATQKRSSAVQKVPLFLKTSESMPRPDEAEYYLLTRNGTFFCRNHRFFQSDVPAGQLPRWLAPHWAGCVPRFPKLGVAAFEYIVGFFYRIYQIHRSEAIVLVYWDAPRKRYRIVVPPQIATVWESSLGFRTALDVKYGVPTAPPPGSLLVASIHSHADGAAYSSWTDQQDELHRDGIHVVCGGIDRDPPELHLELAVDGHRFSLQPEDFFRGYDGRRRNIPQDWIDQLTCKVQRPTRNYNR